MTSGYQRLGHIMHHAQEYTRHKSNNFVIVFSLRVVPLDAISAACSGGGFRSEILALAVVGFIFTDGWPMLIQLLAR